MKPNPAVHWTRLDTVLTLATTLAAICAIIGAATGWNFGPL